ncbi:MAG TPA: HAD family hydrolase [Micromonosporaceae bacterium]
MPLHPLSGRGAELPGASPGTGPRHAALAGAFGTEHSGLRKPNPAIFLAGCETLGIPAADTAYIGDHLDHDARGARGAGLFGVWLNRSGSPAVAPGVPRVTTLAGLPQLLGLAG